MSRLLLLCVVIAVLLMCGCDPVQRIASNTNEIRTEAKALIDHGQQTGDAEVVQRASRIDGLAAGIHHELPKVEAKTPEWLSTLKYWGIAVAALAVAFVLWNSGILGSIRIALGWLPRRKVVDAEMAVAVLDEDKREQAREMIAARRASDPMFDAAYRKVKKADKG